MRLLSLSSLAPLTFLAGLSAFSAAALGATAATGAAAPWLAYGDLRGHLEPCGCDPATDMGGIRRIGALLERERARDAGIGVFALGNALAPATEPQAAVKAPFILEADALNRPTATLVNELELRQPEVIAAFGKAQPDNLKALNYVLSNGSASAASASVINDRFVVLGYTWSVALGKQVQRVDAALMTRWRGLLEDAKGKTKVLLFAGPQPDLEAIAKAKLFDVLISSNASPMAKEPGVEERKDETRLKRLVDPAVYAVPLGGQGVLRGGSLVFDEAKPLSAYLGKEECAPGGGILGGAGGKDCSPGALPFKTAKLVSWLDAASGESEPMNALYRRYNDATKAAFKDASATRLKDLADSPFAGAAACVTCHKAASDIYQGTKHAHAMATLKAKGKQEDGECVACHVVGAAAKGGFVSMAASPQLANVQCENCHGPRKEHVANPAKKPVQTVKAADVCASCHNGQHSPAFQAASYWQRIKH